MRLLVLSLLLPIWLPAQQTIRVISDSKGWTFGTKEVHRKLDLPVTASLTGTKATDLILDCGADGWLSYTCAKLPCRVAACAKKIDGVVVQRIDPDVRNGAAARPSMGELLLSFFNREPKAPETLGVRGGGIPNDAVVSIGAEGVDFAPAFNRVLEGRYCFRLTPLPSGAATTFVLDWDRERTGAGRARVAAVKPGAYTLEKSGDERCSFEVAGWRAWVVATPAGEFSRVDGLWKQYSPWFRELDQTGTSPESLATVRHVVLSSLADMVEKK